MAFLRGSETSGPSVGRWMRKSRAKRSPTGQHMPQSSHRPPRASTIMESPGRGAVATSTTPHANPDSRRTSERSSPISESERIWPSPATGAAMTARPNSRARRQLARGSHAMHMARNSNAEKARGPSTAALEQTGRTKGGNSAQRGGETPHT